MAPLANCPCARSKLRSLGWPGPLCLYTEGITDDWYHIYDYCLGFIANWGVHPLDIAQWGAGMDHSGPVSCEGIGTLPPKMGTFDTIEHWDVHCRYAMACSCAS